MSDQISSGSLGDRINARLPRLRRVLAVLAPLAAVWTVVTQQTDGFEIVVRGVRLFSSRGYRNPLILALGSAAGAWYLSTPADRRSLDARLTGMLQALGRPKIAASLAGVLALGITIFGIARGSFVAGGSDSYGYVSMSRLIAHGTMRVDAPLMSEASWPNYKREAFAPVAYRPAPDGHTIVPIVPPGYPFTMALLEWLSGPSAVFFVVPVLGGVAIFATFLIGNRVAGAGVGLAAAALLAGSPSFLYQQLQPMSDVPVTAWWTLGLALLIAEGPERSRLSISFVARESRGRGAVSTLCAGLACGMAILTRPNLVPLTVIPFAYLVWREFSASRRISAIARSALVFSAGPVLASLAVAAVNTQMYGSPLESGYGSNAVLFSMKNVVPNLRQFADWTFSTETPVVLLALAAPLATRGRRSSVWLLLAFAAGTLGCYLAYVPFDSWVYVRFLLPSFPLLLVLTALVVVHASGRLALPLRTAAVALVVGLLVWRGVGWTRDHSGFNVAFAEAKYVAAGDYITGHLPENAVLLSVMHSGSARHYAGRLTVRFDTLDAPLESVLTDLRRLGLRPYFLLDAAEEDGFRRRFADDRLGRLDWTPLTSIERPFATAVRLYDPEQAQ